MYIKSTYDGLHVITGTTEGVRGLQSHFHTFTHSTTGKQFDLSVTLINYFPQTPVKWISHHARGLKGIENRFLLRISTKLTAFGSIATYQIPWG